MSDPSAGRPGRAIEPVEMSGLSITFEGGVRVEVPPSPARARAIAAAIGLSAWEREDGKVLVASFDDETIEENVLPLLPKAGR